MRPAILLAVVLLTALPGCTERYYGAGIEVNSGGVSVSPRVGGQIGGLTVGVEG